MAGNSIVVLCSLILLIGPLAWGQESIYDILTDEDPAMRQIEAQIQAQEYDYPILWLEENIQARERATHRYDPGLVRPLTLLGDAKAGNGDYDGALDDYQRAVHLSRVSEGLNSASQVQIVYREANIYRALGDYQEANNREEYAFEVLSRSHERYDEALLPGVYRLAEWYGANNNVFPARALYHHAINILAANGKQTTAVAIPAYKGIANSYRLERFPPVYRSGAADSGFSPSYESGVSVNNFPAGERALQQIIQVYRDDPNADPLVLAEAILELADWYLLFDKTRRAYPLYEHVYTSLAEVEGFAVADYFAEPKLLYFPVPQDPRAPPVRMRGERKAGYVEIAYEVSKNGYARELTTVDSEPSGLMDFRVRKALRLSRYRPPLVEGLPMDKSDYRFRHEFAYFPKLDSPETAEGVEGAEGD